MEIQSCIENGHTFQLGTKYSEVMQAMYTNDAGEKHPLVMGCYGIGVGRLMAAIIEVHNDEKGMIWPEEVAPARVHVLGLQPSVQAEAARMATEISEHTSVLFDDRDLSAGQKFAEADLIGIPTRVVMSEKMKAAGMVEVKERSQEKATQMPFADFLKRLA